MAYYPQSTSYYTPAAYPYAYQYAQPSVAMPSYYTSSSSHPRRSRSQSYSQSHAPSYVQMPASHSYGYAQPQPQPQPQPQVYYAYAPSKYPQATAQYPQGTYYDAGRGTHGRPRYHSTSGHSGGYYPSASSHGHRSSSTGGRRRSQSATRYSTQPVYTTSSAHHSVLHSTHPSQYRDRRYSASAEPSVGDRFRRFFGMHPSADGYAHHPGYVDAHTGRTVDWRGRPIYRV
ncbi:uncharacterized protein LAESUDRAFT_719308 [Laetiporus sulphureus 93-53]|uniref:Uncharacterized protein n=1 Tax=Laetiporus sulphureus 93-53 TaxID=1314785 RepID=A0A165IFF4_9APHY|nr:uncharacterized protein LAESUDRAFT_719308 [Laetiporus sulphureus 93-53]KZT13001.1 hypothetical protein LAESUDRAFT_719308 [Laetiporus sulphureus 93-53]